MGGLLNSDEWSFELTLADHLASLEGLGLSAVYLCVTYMMTIEQKEITTSGYDKEMLLVFTKLPKIKCTIKIKSGVP
jgi:hypothetical protein